MFSMAGLAIIVSPSQVGSSIKILTLIACSVFCLSQIQKYFQVESFFDVFFAFVLLIVIAFLLWRIAERVPDLLFHLSEIQKDMDAVRRHVEEKQVD